MVVSRLAVSGVRWTSDNDIGNHHMKKYGPPNQVGRGKGSIGMLQYLFYCSRPMEVDFWEKVLVRSNVIALSFLGMSMGREKFARTDFSVVSFLVAPLNDSRKDHYQREPRHSSTLPLLLVVNRIQWMLEDRFQCMPTWIVANQGPAHEDE